MCLLDGLCDHLIDVSLEDIFKLGASAAANELCEWVQVGIDVHIPHHKYHRLFHERQAIAHACAHAHLEMSRQAKNCLPNKLQITHLDCFYFLQAQRKKEKHKKENIN